MNDETVRDHNLHGTDDIDLYQICRSENRASVTLDRDFFSVLAPAGKPHHFRGSPARFSKSVDPGHSGMYRAGHGSFVRPARAFLRERQHPAVSISTF